MHINKYTNHLANVTTLLDLMQFVCIAQGDSCAVIAIDVNGFVSWNCIEKQACQAVYCLRDAVIRDTNGIMSALKQCFKYSQGGDK